ncbi:GSCOCG00009032001-RA-CDS [Cotesia congregata]|nr:GSCOCG00009032001-RA-CDS [Cotesia congregata]
MQSSDVDDLRTVIPQKLLALLEAIEKVFGLEQILIKCPNESKGPLSSHVLKLCLDREELLETIKTLDFELAAIITQEMEDHIPEMELDLGPHREVVKRMFSTTKLPFRQRDGYLA